jgi:hypothetical protein
MLSVYELVSGDNKPDLLLKSADKQLVQMINSLQILLSLA